MAPSQTPQLFKQERCGDDRRASVKAVAVDTYHAGTAARLMQLLEHLHPPTFGAEANGCRQSTKTAANHKRERGLGVCR
jgi:hypothetical protein